MSRKLLLADDSVVIQKLVGLSFANEQIEIVSTDNGDDAVRLAKEARPDVILADVVMPGRSGYEVCEAIKQDPELAATPVLLLTGTFEAFDEARAASVGADGHVTKPFEAQALVERVSRVIEAAEAAAAAPPAAPVPTPTADDASARIAAPTAARHDLFDAGVTRLAETDPGLVLGVDDANEVTASGLFGAPGEATSDVLDDQGGSMALGQSMDPATADETPSTPVDVEAPLRPLSERVTREDPLADLAEPTPTPLPPARPLDLDEVLAQAPVDDGPVLGATAESENTTTAPALRTPPVTGFDELTVHVPSADIDQDAAAARTPDYAEPMTPAQPATRVPERSHVTDLDASLASPIAAPAPAPKPATAATPPPIPQPATAASPPPIPEPKPASAAVSPRVTASDPLGLGPAALDSDDVDFAFDVSEQATAADLDEAFDDSFASLMDISESQLLSEEMPDVSDTALSSSSEVTDEEPGFAGYDVSTSDLVTSPGDETRPPAELRAGLDPMPEPDPLTEIRELPMARTREPVVEAEQTMVVRETADVDEDAPDEPITGSAGLFDGLVTGSPLDELDDLEEDDFAVASELEVDEDLLEIDPPEAVDAPFAPWRATETHESSRTDFEDVRFDGDATADASVGSDEDELEDGIEITGDETVVTTSQPFAFASSRLDEIPAPRSVAGRDEEAPGLLLSSPHGAPEDRRVPDLSPMMEQRIQETLEKVAWEAFSDLSETIVKQVMGRVEQIAWEVIPEMAETLVREEIRRMKGEED